MVEIKNKENLNPTRAIYSIIGNIMATPEKLQDPSFVLSSRDFVDQFHKIIFSAVGKIIYSNINIKNVTPIDVDNYLSSYPALYKVWSDNNGLKYCTDALEMKNSNAYDGDYITIKKFSLLRNYIENGIDVTSIFDFETNDLVKLTKENVNLEKLDIGDIVEHFTNKIIDIRDDWQSESETIKDFKAGDDLDGLLERLKLNPDLGFPFINKMYNTLFRGMRKGKFLLRSGATGTGKTRQAIMDVCSLACTSMYVTGEGWINLGPAKPALLISTEIDQEELQTIMLAFITGVADSDIKNGNYDKATEIRLKKGIEILKGSKLSLSYIEDFSISDIEMKIEQHIINEGVEYVAFDYIQMTPKLSKSMNTNFGTTLREDQILVHFASALKNIATRYKIFIESSTQLNRGSKEVENRDASSLRGGLSTADKIDYGILTFKVTNDDLSALSPILKKGFGEETPNFSHWVFKNRAGIDHIIIWTYMDLGTMREKILFVTDYNYLINDNLIETSIEIDDEIEESTSEISNVKNVTF